MHRLLLAATVAAAVFAAQAAASTPPTREMLITPTSIDAATPGKGTTGFFASRGDHRYRDPGTRFTTTLWWRGTAKRKVLSATRQIYASQVLDRRGRVALLEYWGPLRTEKGDRLGTPLAVFRRHWPKARVVKASSLRSARVKLRGWNAIIRTRKTTAIFGFDRGQRLRGVAVGSSKELSDFHRVCAFKPLCRQR